MEEQEEMAEVGEAEKMGPEKQQQHQEKETRQYKRRKQQHMLE